MRQRASVISIAAGALALAQMACRPVVTVGWWEMAIFLLLLAIVVLPLLWKVFRWLSGWRAGDDARRKKSKR